MRATVAVLFCLFALGASECALGGSRDDLRIYYYSWDAFPNARITAESIKKYADAQISSRSPAYVAEFEEWLAKFEMTSCSGVAPDNPPSIHLLIELESDGKRQTWVSDKTRLYSGDYRQCVEFGDDFRGKFRWLEPWYAKE